MSEHLRHSSPASSSPGRQHQIARPDWPWAARTYYQRSQQSSPHPVQGSSLQSGWETRTSFSSTSTQSSSGAYSGTPQGRNSGTPRPLYNSPMSPAESTKQWTFTGFEWTVRNVHKLRDFVEGVEMTDPENGMHSLASEPGDFEVLKQSPMLGDHKFKLEIVPVEGLPDNTLQSTTTSTVTRLCLYITSLMVDFPQGDHETYASMMAAIKCQDDRVGERGARPEWVWEFWQNDWVFRRESEVWECPLPTLTTLLENPRIQETDSLVICVQVHSPVGPSIPQQPSVCYVPRDLLDGLEASLDNPNTGDVRFICLEKHTSTGESPTISSSLSTSSEMSSSTALFGHHSTARKRVIYAHSDILIRRSEYFATMLSSSFSENPPLPPGERKVYTIIVEEADFETIYWLLKYCYANWLLFKQNDDPRLAVEGVGAGWSARWISGPDEWDWKRFHKAVSSEDVLGDNRSATSGESLPVSTSVSRSTSRKSESYLPSSSSHAPSSTSTARISPPSKSNALPSNNQRQSNSTATRKLGIRSGSSLTAVDTTSSNATANKPPSISPRTFPSTTQFPVSPGSSRKSSLMLSPSDPHSHPTPTPGPASALSIYQVAHRYAMPNLASLALEHIMSTITAESSFALLLATSLWDDLHSIIEDFVVERWDEVSASQEFEQCCKEVAAGEWGPDGGKTLMSVFRRLRSPAIS